MRSSLHHRRLPSIESTTSAAGSAETPIEKRDAADRKHHTVQFEVAPAPTPSPAPESILTPPSPPGPFANKGRDFWLVFLALCVSSFLAAIDLTGVSTVLVTSEFSVSKRMCPARVKLTRTGLGCSGRRPRL